jgi:FecR-like protein
MGDKETDAPDDELIQNYLENQASPAEQERFRLSLAEESFCRRVAEHAIDVSVLCDQGASERAFDGGRGIAVGRHRRVSVAAAVAASLLLGFGAIWGLLQSGTERSEIAQNQEPSRAIESVIEVNPGTQASVLPRGDRPVIGRVGYVIGHVLTADSLDSQDYREAVARAEFGSGDMLQTVGTESFALLRFDDDSVLAIAGDTKLACSVTDSRKQVEVRGGNVMAQVTSQPEQKPMVITTPMAQAEVLGTTLSLFASLVMTELAVQEGHVRMWRRADDQTVDVKAGESAVAIKDSDLVAKPISPVPSVWEEDFETKWPKRWRAGHWIHYRLPPGSSGAVRAEVREGDDGYAFIATGIQWSRGLFRIQDDTHLNLTYKLNAKRWFYIRVDTRTSDLRSDYHEGYMFRTPKLWHIPTHKWQTVSIPLRAFYSMREATEGKQAPGTPKAGEIAFSLLLRTDKPDPGLMVDRIWVSQGPADGVVPLKSPARPNPPQGSNPKLKTAKE